MIDTRQIVRFLLAILAISLSIPLLERSAVAQVEPPQKSDDEDEPEALAQNQPQFQVNEENFDQWVFGGGGNAPAIQARMTSLLNLRIDEISRISQLSDPQKKKLLLAGRGDLKRLMDQVEQKRKEFQLVRNDQNKFMQFYQTLQSIQMSVQTGPFGDDASIFSKTIKKTLDGGQASRYAEVLKARREYRFRAKLDLVVAMLDNTIGLKSDQRKQLVSLLRKETRPPKKFGAYDSQVVLLQLSKMNESKLKPIFDDSQWRAMKRQLDGAKSMEQFLQNNDLLSEDPQKTASPK